jgi:hypothetical protein
VIPVLKDSSHLSRIEFKKIIGYTENVLFLIAGRISHPYAGITISL